MPRHLTVSDIGTTVDAFGAGALPAGALIDWAGLAASCPSGWLVCNGASLLRAGTYEALFAAIGTAYGTADGTHFNVPDFRNRHAKYANVDGDLGATGGSTSYTPAGTNSGVTVSDHASHTHTYTDVPNHTHVLNVQGGTTAATTGTHVMTSTATGGSARSVTTGDAVATNTGGVASGTTAGPSATLSHTVSSSGTFAGTPATIEPPFARVHKLIKV